MQPKYKQIKVMVLPLEYEQIQEKAKAKALKLSGYVRSVLNISNKLDIKKTKTYNPVDPFLLLELNKIGNNLNQIAKHLNIKKNLDYDTFETLEKIEQYTKIVFAEQLKQGAINDNNV